MSSLKNVIDTIPSLTRDIPTGSPLSGAVKGLDNNYQDDNQPDLRLNLNQFDVPEDGDPDLDYLTIPPQQSSSMVDLLEDTEEGEDEEEDYNFLSDGLTGVQSGAVGFYKSLVSLTDASLGVFGKGDLIADSAWQRDNDNRPQGMFGSAIEGIVQFGLGLLPGVGTVSLLSKAGKAVTGIRFLDKVSKTKAATKAAGFAKKGTAAIVSDFVAFDGTEARLADILVEFPALQGVVTEYLQSDQTDSQFEGRLKNVIEGGAIGGVAAGVVKTLTSSVKILRKVRNNEPVDPADLKAVKDNLPDKNKKQLEQGKRDAENTAKVLEKRKPKTEVVSKESAGKSAALSGEEGSALTEQAYKDQLPEVKEEPITGLAAILGNKRIQTALQGAETVAELEDVMNAHTEELLRTRSRNIPDIAADMIELVRASGEDETEVLKAIANGSFRRAAEGVAGGKAGDGVLLDMVRQEMAWSASYTSIQRSIALSQRLEDLLADSSTPEYILQRVKLEIRAESHRLKRFTHTQAIIGTRLSEGMRMRKTQSRGMFGKAMGEVELQRASAEQIVDDIEYKKVLNLLDDFDTLELEEIVEPLQTPTSAQPKSTGSSALEDTLDDDLLVNSPDTAAEARAKKIEAKEKRLEKLRQQAIEIKKNGPPDLDPKVLQEFDDEIRVLDEKIKYHKNLHANERESAALLQERRLMDSVSAKKYDEIVQARADRLKLLKDLKEITSPNKGDTAEKRLRKIVDSEASDKSKMGEAQRLVKELSDKIESGFKNLGKEPSVPNPNTPYPDRRNDVIQEVYNRLGAIKKKIGEEGILSDGVIEMVGKITAMTDQEFMTHDKHLSVIKKFRNGKPKASYKSSVEKVIKANIKARRKLLAQKGLQFDTKANFNKFLDEQPSDFDGNVRKFMKRVLFAAEGENPLDAYKHVKDLSEKGLFWKLADAGSRWFQGNLIFGIPTIALNVGVPVTVRALVRTERLIGSAVGQFFGTAQEKAAQKAVHAESRQLGNLVEDIQASLRMGYKGLRSRRDVVTDGDNPFDDIQGSRRKGAFDPEIFGVEPDSIGGTIMQWLNRYNNIAFALNAGGDSLNKAHAAYSRLRTNLKTHVNTDPKWANASEETKKRWVEETYHKAVNEEGDLYSETKLFANFATEARKNILESKDRDILLQDPMSIANEFANVKEARKAEILGDRDVLGAIEESKRYAQEVTFTTPREGELIPKINEFREKIPPLKLILPFVNTPANILEFGLKRTPIGVTYETIAPLISKSAAKRRTEYFETMTPTQRAEYRGRLATGVGATTAISYLAYLNADRITGSGPRNRLEKETLKATGWQPQSFILGDLDNPTYVSYARLDPFATIIGMAADIAEHMHTSPKIEQGSIEAYKSLAFTITESLTDKSFLRGLHNVIKVIQEPDIYIDKTFRDIAAGIAVPQIASNIKDVGETEIMLRESRTVIDAVLRKMPLTDEKVPPRRTFLGEAVYKQNPLGIIGSFGPIYTSSKRRDSVDRTIEELVHGFDMPSTKYSNHRLSDMRDYYNASGRQAYDRFLELSSELRIDGKNMRQSLKGLVNSRDFKKLTAEIEDIGGQSALMERDPRITEINKIIRVYRQKAKYEMISEFPELNKVVQSTQKQQPTNPIPQL